MNFAVDLHIHSALSPCADNEMTPNNIVNMAKLKGLDIIAITDHNSAKNCRAVINCASKADILAVPGMEIETREEVHLICLFPDCETALEMQEFIYGKMPAMKNVPEVFGEQTILNENDEIAGMEERLLLTAVNLSINEILNKVFDMGGAVVPAHIDRQSNSVLANLGMLPPELTTKYVEMKQLNSELSTSNFVFGRHESSTEFEGRKILRSSDAHRLGDILERVNFLELEAKTIECLLNELRL